ncbi:hypothetical protein Tco_1444564 [Tanacetum coccineum]
MSMTIQSSVKDKILATSSETSKVENTPAEMLRDLDQQMEQRADDVWSKRNDIGSPKLGVQARKRTRKKDSWVILTYGKEGGREFVLYGSYMSSVSRE